MAKKSPRSNNRSVTISPTEIDMINGIWAGNITLTKAESYVNLIVQDLTNLPNCSLAGERIIFQWIFGQLGVLWLQ